MTRNDFIVECSRVLIDPALALENENIRRALIEKNDSRVIELLETEF